MPSIDREKKPAAALAIMAGTGIPRSSYEPPIVRLLWRMGLPIPLPHFISFGRVALASGGFFGAAWGVLMWLTAWRTAGMPAGVVLAASLGAGIFFGLAMAGYYALGRRKHKLPLWRDLPES